MTNFLQPYNPKWKVAFETISQSLFAALQGLDIDIQHIGSTAIPCLVAKPIVDMDIIIANKALLNPVAAKLEALGYINRGEQGVAGRFAFRQAAGVVPKTVSSKPWQAHHLYVCFSDSLALKNHLLFRDALLKDRKLAAQYGQLKTELAADSEVSKEAYTKRKTEFVLSVLAQAGLNEEELHQLRAANG